MRMGLLELTNPVTGEVKGILAEYTEAAALFG